MDVEGLGLVDERAAVGGHVHQHALLDLPHRLVDLLEVIREVQGLDEPLLEMSSFLSDGSHRPISVRSDKRWLFTTVNSPESTRLA